MMAGTASSTAIQKRERVCVPCVVERLNEVARHRVGSFWTGHQTFPETKALHSSGCGLMILSALTTQLAMTPGFLSNPDRSTTWRIDTTQQPQRFRISNLDIVRQPRANSSHPSNQQLYLNHSPPPRRRLFLFCSSFRSLLLPLIAADENPGHGKCSDSNLRIRSPAKPQVAGGTKPLPILMPRVSRIPSCLLDWDSLAPLTRCIRLSVLEANVV
jgi:hypothetical protein